MDSNFPGEPSGDAEHAPPPAPNAPKMRSLADEPLDVVDRIAADRASEMGDEENWEHYAQIADEIAVHRRGLTLLDRLAASEGIGLGIDVSTAGGSEQWDVAGTLVEVGDGWCRMRVGTRDVVVNVDAIVSVATDRGGLLEPTVASSRRTSWASVFRGFENAGTLVIVRRRLGPPLVGRVVFVGGDHFDLDLAASSAATGSTRRVTIPVDALAILERQ